jgi:hypothetical protein
VSAGEERVQAAVFAVIALVGASTGAARGEPLCPPAGYSKAEALVRALQGDA